MTVASTITNDVESRRRRLNDELVIMTRYLAQFGPNINEIARLTGQHPETVRYRYRKFLLEKGITIQAIPNYANLGFDRLVIIARLSPAFETKAKWVFGLLSDLCYLRSYTRVMLDGEFVFHVAVPSYLTDECAALYLALADMGLFNALEIMKFQDIRNPPMNSESYDFIRATWACDWNSLPSKKIRLPLLGKSKVAKYDRIDLLILKELDIDAGRKLVEMAASLNLSLHALEFHYRDHVKARGLVKNYKLIWQETRHGLEQGTAPRKERYMGLTIILKGATKEELGELMIMLNKTPFLWSEAYGAAYCGELFLPSYAYPEFMSYLDGFAQRVRGKLRVLVMDPAQSLRFTISYALFDGSSKRWRLDSAAVLKNFSLVTMQNSYPSSKTYGT
jgi:DNA-binding Lrp family transcriptional regulator